MKKLICMGLGLAAMSVLADTETILEGSSVSVIPITTSQKVTGVAVPFLEMDDSGNVQVAHLVKTANLSTGDKLYIYDNGNYECWTLADNAWAKSDNVYTMSADGEITEGTGAASTTTREVGTGFFLSRGSASSVTFYVYGKPASVASKTLTANTKTLIGNWTTTTKAPTIANPVAGDAIVIPGDGLGTRYSYNGTSWYGIGSDHKPVTGLPEITAGTGFWYITAEGSTPTVSW